MKESRTMTVNIQELISVINRYSNWHSDNMAVQQMKDFIMEYLDKKLKEYENDMAQEAMKRR